MWFLTHTAGVPDMYTPTGGKFVGCIEQAEQFHIVKHSCNSDSGLINYMR